MNERNPKFHKLRPTAWWDKLAIVIWRQIQSHLKEINLTSEGNPDGILKKSFTGVRHRVTGRSPVAAAVATGTAFRAPPLPPLPLLQKTPACSPEKKLCVRERLGSQIYLFSYQLYLFMLQNIFVRLSIILVKIAKYICALKKTIVWVGIKISSSEKQPSWGR